MAHVKGTGTTSLGRDSQGQRLGVKLFGGQIAKNGSIIVRQKGTKFRAGQNVKRAKVIVTVIFPVTFKLDITKIVLFPYIIPLIYKLSIINF